MTLVKRFAFWPALAIVTTTAASAISDPEHGSVTGTLIGFGVSFPIAYVVDRQRRRSGNDFWHRRTSGHIEET